MRIHRQSGWIPSPYSGTLALVLVLFLASMVGLRAQAVDDCLACHEDPDLTAERQGKEISLFVDEAIYRKSVHGDFECVDCHADLAEAGFPHEENVEPVDCGMCHDQVAGVYAGSLHGQAVKAGERLAPQCWDCHGAHDIIGLQAPASRASKFNIPFMCGRCHKEGTEVTRTYDIPQDSILSHYSLSIHGVGLFNQWHKRIPILMARIGERKIRQE